MPLLPRAKGPDLCKCLNQWLGCSKLDWRGEYQRDPLDSALDPERFFVKTTIWSCRFKMRGCRSDPGERQPISHLSAGRPPFGRLFNGTAVHAGRQGFSETTAIA